MSRRGRVVLVGAGPGAPDLLTLRGERALRGADVVVYDALAAPELLDLAPAAAERIDVGKRGHDGTPRSQDEINALLVARAQAGQRVVRLKGGDPFVFGRGGEEASACRAAGVPFEVVPGVSSPIGALAFAGIPITDRRHAASFAVVTGHKDPSPAREAIRWGELARGADTLVVLMGMRKLPEIAERLLAAGRDPATPAAVVMNGTLPEQRVVEAPLGEIAAAASAAGLGAPAAIVVGNVVRLRASLDWFERSPLFGCRVLVTRSAEQAGPWLRHLRALGARPSLAPMIRIEPVRDAPELAAAIARQAETDLLLLTSANAAREWAARLREAGRDPAARGPRVCCVGPASLAAALEAGFAAERLPDCRPDAEGLLAALRQQLPLAGLRVLLPQAAAARPVLAEGLAASGARVDRVVVYRTLPGAFDRAALNASLRAGELDALSFASPSAARHFVEALDPDGRAAAGRAIVLAIGPTTAAALEELGLPADGVAAAPSVEALAEVLEECRIERARGRAGREGA